MQNTNNPQDTIISQASKVMEFIQYDDQQRVQAYMAGTYPMAMPVRPNIKDFVFDESTHLVYNRSIEKSDIVVMLKYIDDGYELTVSDNSITATKNKSDIAGYARAVDQYNTERIKYMQARIDYLPNLQKIVQEAEARKKDFWAEHMGRWWAKV